MNGFDRLAPIYDQLTKLAFGKSMLHAQTVFLNKVKAGDHVLILGGGTGWLLNELLIRQPECTVWYIDSSSKMIESAKRKCSNHSQVHFILGTEQCIPAMAFDVVILNFFLDLFSEERVAVLAERIKKVTSEEGIWIVTDFEGQGKWWQSILLSIMIWFFRLVCNIEAKRLPDLKHILAQQRMIEIATCAFFKGFIRAGLHAKTMH